MVDGGVVDGGFGAGAGGAASGRLVAALSGPCGQAEFGALVGVSQQAVSEFLKSAAIVPGVSAHRWLLAYCERLREQAAGRLSGTGGGLDLVQERAGLAREQRIAQQMKNAVAAREYAPVSVLAQVLADASASVATRLDGMQSLVARLWPEVPPAVRDAMQEELARARNDWVKSTADLLKKAVEDLDVDTADGLYDYDE